LNCVRFRILTEPSIKITILWDVTSCLLVVRYQRFFLHFQDGRETVKMERERVPPKSCFVSTKVHFATSQKTAVLSFKSVTNMPTLKCSNLSTFFLVGSGILFFSSGLCGPYYRKGDWSFVVCIASVRRLLWHFATKAFDSFTAPT
jgi:hypothetical protein